MGHRLFYREWEIAYRLKPSGSILTDTYTPFVTVPNTKELVGADPFLFNYEGKKYLFAELLETSTNLGRIGYAVWDGEKFGDWKVVIKEPYHMSYPNIFVHNNEIYMMPEASGSDELYLYKAVEFPDRWEKSSVIIPGHKLVDSTILVDGDERYLFTYNIDDYNSKYLLLYSIDEEFNITPNTERIISINDALARPGGNFFTHNGKVIRVGQNCDGDYGKGLVFLEVEKIAKDSYEEKAVKNILSKDLQFITKELRSGIHTYNADDEMEVIDYHKSIKSLKGPIEKIRRKLF